MCIRDRINYYDSKWFCKNGLVGVRIIKHWVSNVVKELNRPIVTTSANISESEKYPVDIKTIEAEMLKKVDGLFYDGPTKYKKPSVIINPYTGWVLRE